MTSPVATTEQLEERVEAAIASAENKLLKWVVGLVATVVISTASFWVGLGRAAAVSEAHGQAIAELKTDGSPAFRESLGQIREQLKNTAEAIQEMRQEVRELRAEIRRSR